MPISWWQHLTLVYDSALFGPDFAKDPNSVAPIDNSDVFREGYGPISRDLVCFVFIWLYFRIKRAKISHMTQHASVLLTTAAQVPDRDVKLVPGELWSLLVEWHSNVGPVFPCGVVLRGGVPHVEIYTQPCHVYAADPATGRPGFSSLALFYRYVEGLELLVEAARTIGLASDQVSTSRLWVQVRTPHSACYFSSPCLKNGV